MTIAASFLFMPGQAKAEPPCETFFYSDSREVLSILWKPGETATAAIEDVVAWVNSLIGEEKLVINDDTRVWVDFEQRSNQRVFFEWNVFSPEDTPISFVGLFIYDIEAEGMIYLSFPYTPLDTEFEIERKREDGVTKVKYEWEQTGDKGSLEVKVEWNQLIASVWPPSVPGNVEHLAKFAFYRSVSNPGALLLMKVRRTDYILVDEGDPTENLADEMDFEGEFEWDPNIDYQSIFGDPGNILDEVIAITAGEMFIYRCP